jgi:hypothetical protein
VVKTWKASNRQISEIATKIKEIYYFKEKKNKHAINLPLLLFFLTASWLVALDFECLRLLVWRGFVPSSISSFCLLLLADAVALTRSSRLALDLDANLDFLCSGDASLLLTLTVLLLAWLLCLLSRLRYVPLLFVLAASESCSESGSTGASLEENEEFEGRLADGSFVSLNSFDSASSSASDVDDLVLFFAFVFDAADVSAKPLWDVTAAVVDVDFIASMALDLALRRLLVTHSFELVDDDEEESNVEETAAKEALDSDDADDEADDFLALVEFMECCCCCCCCCWEGWLVPVVLVAKCCVVSTCLFEFIFPALRPLLPPLLGLFISVEYAALAGLLAKIEVVWASNGVWFDGEALLDFSAYKWNSKRFLVKKLISKIKKFMLIIYEIMSTRTIHLKPYFFFSLHTNIKHIVFYDYYYYYYNIFPSDYSDNC